MEIDQAIDLAGRYTKSSRERITAMVEALKYIEDIGLEGDVVECGVWQAGNIMLARAIAPRRVCWLFDTFAGMTPPGEFDTKRSGIPGLQGKQRFSLDEVKGNLRRVHLYDDRYLRFVKGDVCETLDRPENLPQKIALLRLDTDWYASTKKELDVLYPLLQSNGILIVDDYGHWMGCKKAVDEYFGDALIIKEIDYSAIMTVKQ